MYKLVETKHDRRGEVETYESDRYRVQKITGFSRDDQRRPMVWLSIIRLDDGPFHDWRDLQRIKNVLCGPEYEAVEIYPPESDLVDYSNTFHLWVFMDGGKCPFGFRSGRRISDPRLNPPEVVTTFRQREFDVIPPDAGDAISVGMRIPNATPPLLPPDEGTEEKAVENRVREHQPRAVADFLQKHQRQERLNPRERAEQRKRERKRSKRK